MLLVVGVAGGTAQTTKLGEVGQRGWVVGDAAQTTKRCEAEKRHGVLRRLAFVVGTGLV